MHCNNILTVYQNQFLIFDSTWREDLSTLRISLATMEKWPRKWEASWQTGSYKFRFVIPSWLERGTINSHIYRTYTDRHKSSSVPMLLIWMTLICIWFQKLDISIMMNEICSYNLNHVAPKLIKELEKLLTAICSWKFSKKSTS